jgi:hypothetical protein
MPLAARTGSVPASYLQPEVHKPASEAGGRSEVHAMTAAAARRIVNGKGRRAPRMEVRFMARVIGDGGVESGGGVR